MDKYKHETISFHERNTFAYFFFFNSLLFHNMLQSEISTFLFCIPSQGVVQIAKLTSIKMRKRKRIEITVTTLKKKRNENEIFLIKRTRPTTRYKKNIWLVVNSTFIQNYDTIAESWLGFDQQPFQLRLIGRRPRIALGRSILLVIGGSYPPETRFTGDVNSSEKSGELSCGARSKSMHGEEGGLDGGVSTWMDDQQ